MPKRKKRTALQKKKKEEGDDLMTDDGDDSLDRAPVAKKVAAVSSTSHLEDEQDHVPSYSSISLVKSGQMEGDKTVEDSSSLSHFWCNYCEYSTHSKQDLVAHIRQHRIRCSFCPFNSLSRNEVAQHCKIEHNKELEPVRQETESVQPECEMDKDPCSACVFCDFMTYSTDHLEKHTKLHHPGMLPNSSAKMISKQLSSDVRTSDAQFYTSGINEKPDSSSSLSALIIEEKNVSTKLDEKPILLPPSWKVKTPEKTMDQKPVKSVKVETLFCLTCPYTHVQVEMLKCHTISQHPVGATVASFSSCFNFDSARPQDLTFFCVKENCSQSTSDLECFCAHLMECCADRDKLGVAERERLKSTVTYITDCHKKHKSNLPPGFVAYSSSVSQSRQNYIQETPSMVASPLEQKQLQNPNVTFAHTETPTSEPSSQWTNPCVVPNPPDMVSNVALSHNVTMNTAVTQGQQPFNSANIYQPMAGHMVNNAPNMVVTEAHQHVLPQVSVNQQPISFQHNPVQQGQHSNLSNGSNTSMAMPQNNVQQGYNGSGNINSQFQSTMPVPANNQSVSTLSSHTNHNWNQSSGGQNFLQNQVQTAEQGSGQPTFSQVNSSHQVPSSQYAIQDVNTHSGNMHQQQPASYLPPGGQADNVNTGQNQMLVAPVGLYRNSNNQFHQNLPNQAMPANQHGSTIGGLMVQTNYSTPNQSSGIDLNQPMSELPQPKMLDLLSDSYSLLLDGPDVQPIHGSDTSFSQQPQSALQITNVSGQQQSQLVPEANIPNYQTFSNSQHMQQSLPANSHLPLPNASATLPISQGQGQFSAVKNISHMPTHQSTNNTNLMQNSSHMPNFLVPSSGINTNSSADVQQSQHSASMSSFLNSNSPNIASLLSPEKSVQGLISTATPPKNPSGADKGSPLNPSIYLSKTGQRNQSSNFGVNSMHPRGGAVPAYPGPRVPGGLPPMRGSHPIGPQYNHQLAGLHPQRPAAQRFSMRGRSSSNRGSARGAARGAARGTARGAARGRPSTAPMGRGSNSFNPTVIEDDEDVIVTAVVKTKSPAPQTAQRRHASQMPQRGHASQMPQRGNASQMVERGPAPQTIQRGRGAPLQMTQRGRGTRGMPDGRAGHRLPIQRSQLPPSPQAKAFDASRHFEDLACFGAGRDENVQQRNQDDDLQIVSVTPGKSQAVNAANFSFCCVHCGMDQGSKDIMKKHMTTAHNDSILGAFRDVQTGRLLFFCPKMTCEFMTYDEGKLLEHIRKCYNCPDKTKLPFDLPFALSNLRALKITQIELSSPQGTHPNDMGGQGLRDNFNDSLTDAFDNIVENVSGRTIVRPVAPSSSRQRASAGTPPQAMAHHMAGPRGPIRGPMNRHPESPRASAPSMYQQQLQTRLSRPYRPRGASRGRPPGPQGLRMPMPRQPMNPGSMPRRPINPGSMPRQMMNQGNLPARGRGGQIRNVAPPQNSVRPAGGGFFGNDMNTPIEIDLDADSPPRPGDSNNQSSLNSSTMPQTHITANPQILQYLSYRTGVNVQAVAPPTKRNDSSHQLANNAPPSVFHPAQIINQPGSTAVAATSTGGASMDTSALQTAPFSGEVAPGQDARLLTKLVSQASQETGSSSSNPQPDTSISSVETQSEESKINTIVLEKVFAKVPHMPKYLSRRLVTKFKRYATMKGLKITADSKVIDEFVNKIYYKGPSTNTTDTQGHAANPVAAQQGPNDDNHTQTTVESQGTSDVHQGQTRNVNEGMDCDTVSSIADVQEKQVESQEDGTVKDKDETTLPGDTENQNKECKSGADLHSSEDPDDIITTQVVLPERSLKFSGAFASLLKQSKLKAAQEKKSSQPGQDVVQSDNMESLQCDSDAELPELTSFGIKTPGDKSASDQLLLKSAIEPSLCFVEQQQNYQLNSVRRSLFSTFASTRDLTESLSEPEDNHSSHSLHVKDKLLDGSLVGDITSYPKERPASTGCIFAPMPIVNPTPVVAKSGVENLLLGHDNLEVDIAGNPLNLEGNQNDLEGSLKLKAKPCFFDKTTGKLTLKVTKGNGKRKGSTDSLDKDESAQLDIQMKLVEKDVDGKGRSQGSTETQEKDKDESAQLDIQMKPVEKEVKVTNGKGRKKGSTETQEKDKEGSAQLDSQMKPVEKEVQVIKGKGKKKGSTETQEKDKEESVQLDSQTKPAEKDKVKGKLKRKGSPEMQEKDKDESVQSDSQLKLVEKDLKVTKGKVRRKGSPEMQEKDKEESAQSDTPMKPVEKDVNVPGEDGECSKEKEPFVRRSDRKRKEVRSYDKIDNANLLEELMSEEDDDYNLDLDDEDYDDDSGTEFKLGHRPVKKIKRVKKPIIEDPTQFDMHTKGSFKCWVCNKKFTLCMSVKRHIIKKHKEGLCAIYLKTVENKSVPELVVFCPKECKYSTTDVKAFSKHDETCEQPMIKIGEDDSDSYAQINQLFIKDIVPELIIMLEDGEYLDSKPGNHQSWKTSNTSLPTPSDFENTPGASSIEFGPHVKSEWWLDFGHETNRSNVKSMESIVPDSIVVSGGDSDSMSSGVNVKSIGAEVPASSDSKHFSSEFKPSSFSTENSFVPIELNGNESDDDVIALY